MSAAPLAHAQTEGSESAPAAGESTAPPVTEEAEPAASPAPGRPVIEDTEHAVRLRGLEERVNDLKERVFRNKARLLLLRETVLNGVISGARARVVHVNDVGSAFDLEAVSYALDGAPLLSKTSADGSLDDQRQIELFNGSIVPGNHNLSLAMRFRGNGYGVFSYLRAYTFNVQSSYAFTAEEGKLTTVKAVAYEKGGFTTDLQERLAIRYDVDVRQNVEEAAPAPTAEAEDSP
ncbi:MAG: dihydrolipoamide acetyltransferase [Myxococcales bacterium]|nr:dihydrolipoamide acetyltransferase [Myxococcales bacterium]